MIWCLPQRAFSTRIPASLQSWTNLSFSFWIFSSIRCTISESFKLSKSYFLFTLINKPLHFKNGPKRPIPLVTGSWLNVYIGASAFNFLSIKSIAVSKLTSEGIISFGKETKIPLCLMYGPNRPLFIITSSS